MEDIVIVSAARTPVGNFNGSFAAMPAHELGKVAVQAAMERAGLEPGQVDEVILGQILAAGEGQNPARQAARAAGIPDEKTAFGINQLCGSGLRAVALAGVVQNRVTPEPGLTLPRRMIALSRFPLWGAYGSREWRSREAARA